MTNYLLMEKASGPETSTQVKWKVVASFDCKDRRGAKRKLKELLDNGSMNNGSTYRLVQPLEIFKVEVETIRKAKMSPVPLEDVLVPKTLEAAAS